MPGSSRSHGDPVRPPAYFRWRNTFIETEPCGSDGSVSPRASSAPEVDRSSDSEMFSRHRQYVDNLSDRLSSTWLNRAAERARSVSMTSEDRDPNDDIGMIPTTSGSTATVMPTDTELLGTAVADARANSSPHHLHFGMTRNELREHMGAKTHEVNETIRYRERKQAMEAIEELPEQVDEVLQQKVNTVLEEVQGKVAAIQEIVRVEKEAVGHKKVAQAMESLEAIPSIILGNFESNVAKAKVTIRHLVDDMQESIRTGQFASNEERVAFMRSLPVEVQQIAGDALEAAKHESKAQARVQLNDALAKMPARVSEVVWEPVPLVPLDADEAARQAAAEPMEQAVAAVTADEEKLTQVVANQVVSEFLLRAKTIKKDEALPEPLQLAAAAAAASSSSQVPVVTPNKIEQAAVRQWVGLAELKQKDEDLGTPSWDRRQEWRSDAIVTRGPSAAMVPQGLSAAMVPQKEWRSDAMVPQGLSAAMVPQKEWRSDAMVPRGSSDAMVPQKERPSAAMVPQAFSDAIVPRGSSDAMVSQKERPSAAMVPQAFSAAMVPRGSSDAMVPQEQSVLQLPNSGSLGHPDLCARPCLYYAVGDCKNGAACDFCHLDHPRRPTHLDKRHRAMLQQLPVEECVGLLLPVLRKKVQSISQSPRAVAMVDALATLDPPRPPSSGRKCRRSSRELAIAMEVMSLRMFLTSLHRSMLAESPRRKQILDDLLRELREECLGRQSITSL